MTERLSKKFVSAVGLATILTSLFIISEVRAQEAVCYHDPYPSEAQSREVPCSDPSCNVGPCSYPEGTGCWRDPAKETPASREQSYRVACYSEECNVGPCTNQKAVREEQVNKREEARVALLERVQDRVINLTANVVARLEGATARFEQIIARIETRIEKLEGRGVDTERASAVLETAKEKLRMAEEGLENLTSIRQAVSGDNPREAFAVVRTELRQIHFYLKETHAELRTVIALLKDAVQDATLPQDVSSAVTDAERGTSTKAEETDN